LGLFIVTFKCLRSNHIYDQEQHRMYKTSDNIIQIVPMGRLVQYITSVRRYVVQKSIVFSMYHMQRYLLRQRLVRMQRKWFAYKRTAHIREFMLQQNHRILRSWFTSKRVHVKSVRRISLEFIFGPTVDQIEGIESVSSRHTPHM
jgi:ABC-type iron transport system FetAB permease component